MMPMPSEMFGSVTVLRYSAGSYDSHGRWSNGSESEETITACVQPAGPNDLLSLEEGERTKDAIALWSQDAVYTLDEVVGTKADRISWGGAYWQVRKVDHFGITPDLQHYHAIALREQAS